MGDSGETLVTTAQCAKTHTKINGELKTIKDALIGSDMRGGLVKDVGVIKETLKEIDRFRKRQEKQEQTKARDWVDIVKKLGTGAALVIFTLIINTFF